ncbi:hypothetical protein AB0N89_20560 [Amycolatopsis sp. NPDC089917]|uniref:hypothetical protein n=1 Tax=Amycolatopsis sp. NPDC089917 TaxID=3155187 RepID=UPI00344A6282
MAAGDRDLVECQITPVGNDPEQFAAGESVSGVGVGDRLDQRSGVTGNCDSATCAGGATRANVPIAVTAGDPGVIEKPFRSRKWAMTGRVISQSRKPSPDEHQKCHPHPSMTMIHVTIADHRESSRAIEFGLEFVSEDSVFSP